MRADALEIAREAGVPVAAACRAHGSSRSGAYARRRRGNGSRVQDTAALDVEVTAAHRESRGRYGSPRIYETLKARGRRVARKRVAHRMRVLGLAGRRPKRFRRTTDSRHAHPIAPNLLARRFEWARPNRAWVGDITYVWTATGWVYLAILVDLCTRAIVGHATSTECNTELALAALDAAVARHRPAPGLLHHSDRGVQYASGRYRRRLRALGMTVSMSRKGNCWDNAVAESTIGTIKAELLDGWTPLSFDEVRRALFPYVEGFYNRQRLHSTLGYRAPADVEQDFTQGLAAA